MNFYNPQQAPLNNYMKVNYHPQTIPLFFSLYMQLDLQWLETTPTPLGPQTKQAEKAPAVYGPMSCAASSAGFMVPIYQTLQQQ